ncbi:hypothetical protein [Heyndrickxia oleronia]|uniref:hypothetical protein n=1 Tax=Heyndrickxia oleronia TaxID=38875 RepID=UPI001B2BDA4A|nr:hypothetical protein [Heyndrickxia oleronia]GIN39988.1 hypothetical protein J19TS1_29370 [Heyndrickxia oleronia]
MFDWFLILCVTTTIIIYSLDHVVNDSNIHHFFRTSEPLGIKKGTVLVWGTFFSAWIVTLTLYSTINFGLGMSTLFVLIIFLLYYFLLAKLVPYIRNENDGIYGLEDLYRNRFSNQLGRIGVTCVLVIANLDGLIIQPALAGWLYGKWFNKSPFIFLIILFIFIIILGGLGGMNVFTRSTWLLLLIGGCSLIYLPLHTYLGRGIHQVFYDYQEWSKRLHPTIDDGLFFLIVIIILGIGKLSTSLIFWRNMFSIKKSYYSITIKLGILGSLSIPLSLLAFFTYEVTKNQELELSSLFNILVHHESYSIIQLAILIWLVGLAQSGFNSLYSITSLFYSHFEKKERSIRLIYMTSVIIGGVSLILACLFISYALEAIQFYLLFLSSTAFPCMAILFKKQKLNPWIFYIIFMSFLFSCVAWIITNNFNTYFLLSVGISSGLALFIYFFVRTNRENHIDSLMD